MSTLILINKTANNGSGIKKWKTIQEEVLPKLMDDKIHVVSFTPPFDIISVLKGKNVNKVIFGGGDGTFQNGINTIETNSDLCIGDYTFGAIGLGSSNDLHKPFNKTINGIPVRLGSDVVAHDLGRVKIISNNESYYRYFVINASLGITAYGNELFNKPDALIRFMKSKWVNLAINYTALKAILLYKNLNIFMDTGEGYKPINLSSANIIKSRYISGGLKIDQEINADDGRLGLHTCEDMSKMELIKVFNDMQKDKFSGKPKRHSSFVGIVKFKSDQLIPVELDGEIFYGQEFHFDLLPNHIKILQ